MRRGSLAHGKKKLEDRRFTHHGDRTLMCPMRVNENDDASPFDTRARVVYYIHREHSGHVIIEQQAKHLRRGIGIQFCDGKWTSKKRKAATRIPDRR